VALNVTVSADVGEAGLIEGPEVNVGAAYAIGRFPAASKTKKKRMPRKSENTLNTGLL